MLSHMRYIGPNNSCATRLDYIMCSNSLRRCISEFGVINQDSNMSNHIPVKITVKMELDQYERGGTEFLTNMDSPRVAWCKVKDNHIKQYQMRLDESLKQSSIPSAAFCQDMQCCDPTHRYQIDEWCSELTDKCIDAGLQCLPKRRHKSKIRPGWSEEVKSFKEDSLFWYQVWRNCGEPCSGDIYETMKNAKRQYAYAARKVIRKEKQLRFERMAKSINSSETRNFWEEIKRLRRSNHKAPNIDGETSDNDIAEIFRMKYRTLYNSVPSCNSLMNDIQQHIDKNITESDVRDTVVKECEVLNAVKQLKLGKSDGDKQVFSDHIKHAPKRMFTFISILLTTANRHGYMPCDLLLSTLCSIPKDVRANICSSDNYRGIALSSCLTKIFDLIVLNRYKNELSTSDMQFAFKGKHGTTMCTLVMKEVMSHFKRNGSAVYAGLIDASKAFDRVRHDKLFWLLIERKLPAVTIRLLLDSYKRQQLRTAWNKSYSEVFSTSNGIKQGSILSPVLFTVYMDSLLMKLEASGYGCKIGQHYFGALSYADDLSLLCPTLYGLQQMLNICQKFGEEYGVKYNPAKSVGLCVNQRQQPLPDIFLAGQAITWVSSVKHLGNFIQADLSEKTEVINKRGDFIGRVNGLLANYSSADDILKQEIFNKQCCHLYGAEAWDMTASHVEQFRKTWNHGVRKVFKLPYRTHTRLLYFFTNQHYVMDRIYRRFQKLILMMQKSENERVAYLVNAMIHDSSSIISRNLQCISSKYDLNYYQRYNYTVQSLRSVKCEDDFRLFCQIQEIRTAIRDSDMFLSTDELEILLEFLCCD